MKPLYPNFIIGGSPKCGSSSLFFWLAQHPEVCASSIKETGFLLDKVQRYNQQANYLKHGLDKYESFFSHYKNQKILMEATPEYLIQKEIPFKAFSEMEVKPKVLFIFRRPSDRIYSAYKFHKYTTRVLPSDLSIENYLGNEYGKHMLYITRYAEHLQYWIDQIGRDAICVSIFEEMKVNPRVEMKRISDWLGIDQKFWDDYGFDAKNQTTNIGNYGVHRLALVLRRFIPTKFIEGGLKPIYYKLNGKQLPSITDKENKMKKEIDLKFVDANEELSGLLGKDLSALWNNRINAT